MKHIKIYEIFETNSEKEFDKVQIENLKDIFQDLKDEFLDEIDISIKRNANSTDHVYYLIKINYSKLLFDVYTFRRYRNFGDRSESLDKMIEYSRKLSKFWEILNRCFPMLKSEYDFDDGISSSPLDDSCFFGENIKIMVAYKK